MKRLLFLVCVLSLSDWVWCVSRKASLSPLSFKRSPIEDRQQQQQRQLFYPLAYSRSLRSSPTYMNEAPNMNKDIAGLAANREDYGDQFLTHLSTSDLYRLLEVLDILENKREGSFAPQNSRMSGSTAVLPEEVETLKNLLDLYNQH
ncbi:uncharacterized protein [Lepeophtheirus salmonis]|uniref:uncharacterized protein n=1 Tax=Lepeophtheirus salmonis TaxID=72036 RepID=UPI001AE2773C|nr:uncharacterized protein LOC121120684 [Lepeophtheirus salmonis]XP_040571484.1 uncharacterized protein LOC121120684 [Lepeophtheirus salmonis]